MIPLRISLDGDGAFSDLADREDVQRGQATQIAALAEGMESGKTSIAFRIEADDGSVVIAETSWALLHAACGAIEARYGRPT